MKLKFNEEVDEALENQKPVVALESTVIAHGLPYPQNLETASRLEKIVRENGAIPATIAVFDGEFHVGLNDTQIEQLANGKKHSQNLAARSADCRRQKIKLRDDRCDDDFYRASRRNQSFRDGRHRRRSSRIFGRCFGGFAGTGANADNGRLFGREDRSGFARDARMARNKRRLGSRLAMRRTSRILFSEKAV